MAESATFDEFVTTRARHLLRVAYLLTGDHALAEDLLQTTLVKCWSAWRRIDGDPEPYVLRVLANTFSTQPTPLNRVLKSVDPAKITRIDAGGPHSVTVVWRGSLILQARSQTPGRLRISVDGVAIHTLDFGTLPWTVQSNDGSVTPPWGAAPISASLQAGRNRISGGRWDPVPGSLVTISVEAERMTGDWFVAFYPSKE